MLCTDPVPALQTCTENQACLELIRQNIRTFGPAMTYTTYLAYSRIFLPGEEAEHRIQHIQKKFKSIVDSFVLVSDNLLAIAETCRRAKVEQTLTEVKYLAKLADPS